MRANRERPLHDALNLIHIPALIGRRERNGGSGHAGAAGAADAVNVIFHIIGEVVVDDQLDAFDVDAAGGDIGRDQHAVAAIFEALERFTALTQ